MPAYKINLGLEINVVPLDQHTSAILTQLTVPFLLLIFIFSPIPPFLQAQYVFNNTDDSVCTQSRRLSVTAIIMGINKTI